MIMNLQKRAILSQYLHLCFVNQKFIAQILNNSTLAKRDFKEIK